MNNNQSFDRMFVMLAWGLLLIWWGLRWWPLSALPNGSGLLGTGLILLGVNAARALTGVPTRRLTTILGILSLAVGGVVYLSSEVYHLSYQIPLFEAALIVCGAFIIFSALYGRRIVSKA